MALAFPCAARASRPGGTTVEGSIMQMAQARGAKVWSSPWTPPAAFKSSGALDGGNYLGSGANATNLAYASQLAGYVVNMKNTYGVNIYAVSIQNEPDVNHPDPGGYETCLWSSQQIHDFTTNLYNALSASNVASTLIMMPESGHWDDPNSLGTTTIGDPVSLADVGIIAYHDYVTNNAVGDTNTPAVVNSYGKALWETEVSILSGSDSSISNGLYYATRIHLFLTVAQVNAWHYWWLISGDGVGNQGLMDANAATTKRLFAVGQYSRFVRPGYYRIDATNTASALVSAYKDPVAGNFAIVAINSTSNTINQTFNLTNFTAAASVTPWITSATLSLASQTAVAVTNSTFTYMLPAQSIVTFVGQAATNIVTNVASFTASPTNGIAPLSVTFTDTSTGSITNRFWNFGDSATSNTTATSVAHVYSGAGTYTVTLIVSGSGGASTNNQPNYITAVNCTPPTASVSGDQAICQGGSATIQAALTGTGPWTVTWLDGISGTNYMQNGVGASPAMRTVSPGSTTTYTVTAVSDASGCSGGTSSGSATITVNAIPATPTAGNNGPICSGGTLMLSTPTMIGATYSWTGPNGFSSTQQNPSITNATSAASGTYGVTVTDSNGCTSAAGSTTAMVNAIPATPTAGNNGPILGGNTLNLTASTVSSVTYSWTGPNGFTSTNQSPSISNAMSAASGTYGVTITDTNGCASATGATTALVTALQITSIAPQGGDMLIAWTTTGGTTNVVQATPGNPGYNTNFVDISAPLLILGSGDARTNYVDSGAATNSPVMFYRVRLVP